MTAFPAIFLIGFGLIQLTAGFWQLRGWSAVGSLYRAGVMLGFLAFVGGVYLALAEPADQLLWLALPGLLAGALASLFGGVITSWTVNPTRALLHPPAEAAYTTGDVAIPLQALGDGAVVPGTWFAPAAGARRPAVLLICGANDNRMAFKWRIVAECLSRGLAVLTIDPPGHGAFRSAPMTAGHARAAASAALDWLCARPEVSRAGAIGISLGGCQAADLAARDRRVTAVALVCAPARLSPLTAGVYAREIAGLLLPRNLALLREASVLTLWREWRSMKAAWFGHSLYSLIDEFNPAAAARAIGDRPVLIVHGTRDAVVPVSNARALCQAASPPRQLILAPQATHLSLVLYAGEMGRMAEWLSARLGRAPASPDDVAE